MENLSKTVNKTKLICICGSAGSIQTVIEFISSIPKKFTTPFIILIHRQHNYVSNLQSILQKETHYTVVSPESNTPILPKTIYVAPPMYHMQVEQDKTISYAVDEPVNFSRPSIDVFLETVSKAYQKNVVVIMLSGASIDGAKGVRYIENKGGKVYIQSPEETSFKTMLHAALNASRKKISYPTKTIITYLYKGGDYN